jgi:hypothetical protein
MLNFLTIDWVGNLFDYVSLRIYEKEQERHRQLKQQEKTKIIKNNRIIVKVNNDIIYDSKKDKEMSDELYFALLSYGLMDSVNSKSRNKKTPINYNIFPSISTMPMPNNLQNEVV